MKAENIFKKKNFFKQFSSDSHEAFTSKQSNNIDAGKGPFLKDFFVHKESLKKLVSDSGNKSEKKQLRHNLIISVTKQYFPKLKVEDHEDLINHAQLSEKLSSFLNELNIVLSKALILPQKFYAEGLTLEAFEEIIKFRDGLKEIRVLHTKQIDQLTLERNKKFEKQKFEIDNFLSSATMLQKISNLNYNYLSVEVKNHAVTLSGNEKKQFLKESLDEFVFEQIIKYLNDPDSYKLPENL